ncbi:hypothetical protein FE257_003567 [Aspergillus nanangensis]|uniref:Uncharacterized protein n=1 Tax=Aspergillus nanangensis TaxID=2582783 RepID=A0AAD4CBE8_ASPNN|nr:hypothetical protein FE257_003567 [Aspergillus nanangensis]
MSWYRNLYPPKVPLALRPEHITEFQVALELKPHDDPRAARKSPRDYVVRDADGITQFTASGWSFNGMECREIRDSSGLPLFELHHKARAFKHSWDVTLPGARDKPLISAHVKTGLNKFEFPVTVENAVVGGGCKKVTLQVHPVGPADIKFFVTVDNRKIMAFLRDVFKPGNLTTKPYPDVRSGWEAVIAPDVDLSLATIVLIMISDWIRGGM